MNQIKLSASASKLAVFLLLIMFATCTLRPVQAQTPFNLNWTFDYSPLVAGANNSLQIRVTNTGNVPLQFISVGIHFTWMNADAYITKSGTLPEVPAQQKQLYNISFQVPDSVLTGRYSMNTLLVYQVFQQNGFTGAEAIVYVLDIVVLGRTSQYSLTFNPLDWRIYSVIAVLTLAGWFLPKRILQKVKR